MRGAPRASVGREGVGVGLSLPSVGTMTGKRAGGGLSPPSNLALNEG